MSSDTIDFRNVALGSTTTQGTVQHIYGANQDWIVFLNESGDLKTLTQPDSQSEKLAETKINSIAKDLNLKAFQKLDKAQWSTNIDVLGSCVVLAFQSPDKIKESFVLYEKFTSKAKATKNVFGKGPDPQHIVYLNEDNDVGWEFREKVPSHMNESLALLDDIRQVTKRVLPKVFRKEASTTIGSAALAVIRTGLNPAGQAIEELVENAIIDVKSTLQTYNSVLYSIPSVISLSLPVTWIYLNGSDVFSAAILGGMVGALLSSFQRTRDISRSSWPSVLLQAISRVILGAISGAVIVALSKSGLALAMFAENIWALLIFGIVSGISERWLPDTLLSVGKNSTQDD